MRKLIILLFLIVSSVAIADTIEVSTYGSNIGIGTTSRRNALSVRDTLAVGSETYTSTAVPTNGMLVEGNVGIGTVTASSKLRVFGSVDVTGTLTTAASADPSIILNTATSTDTDFWIGVQEDSNGVSDDILTIGTGTSVGSNKLIYINPSGNIGVASTSPGVKVDVVGDVRVSTEVYDATGWNGDLTVPTKDAVRDKIETIGAGSGDNISVDGSAVIDPNFASTGDIDFVDTSNTVTANVNANSVALSTDTTGNYIADVTGTANEIFVSGTGSEGATASLSLSSLVKGWTDDGTTVYASTTSDNVGIGTVTNTLAKLMVSNADSVDSFRVDDSAVDISPFIVNAAGNVGLGTTTAGAKLSLVQDTSATGTSGATFVHNGVQTASVIQASSSAVITTGGILTLTSSSTSGSNTGTVLKATQSGTGSSGYVAYLEDIASDPSPFVITNTGNVGIGTTTPNNTFIITTGNVGIATTGPSYTVEVNGTLQADDIYSGDGTQGTTATCGGVSVTSITIKDGLITACTGT